MRVLVAAGLAAACSPAALPPAQSAAKPSDIRLYSIGHSLSSEVPDMTASLAKATPGLSYRFQEQFRLGASLQMQWEEAEKPRVQFDDKEFRVSYPKALPQGGWNKFVLIESVPRGGAEQEANAIEYLTRFAKHIAKTNPGAKIYYAEGWHSLLSGTGKAQWDNHSPTRTLSWRKRLDADAPMWERIRSKAAAASGQTITMIPQAKALAALSDAAAAGKLPGFKKIEDLFGDDIHLNPYGMYLLGCLQYAVVFGRSPEGLPIDLKNRWGGAYWDKPFYNGKIYPRPNPAAMKEMQRIAWRVASR